MAQITPKTDEQKLAIIADRLKFAEANKGVPYLFKVSSGYDKALTDAKDKQMAQGNYLLPAIYYLNAENELQQVVGMPDAQQLEAMFGPKP